MPRGARIKMSELSKTLAALDIDEGIRVEHAGSKMFINKNSSGTFVVQFDDSSDFRYLQSARQVIGLVNSTLGSKGAAWIY
ncbi:MAG TPA: hypothetical protein VHL10_02015 [Nitrososphaera sp.]|nr:hypothetical protein [Nitrososphaera sp.]